MQFPWREYIWLVILLGLAIGLAVEQSRVKKLTAFHEQAAAAEKTARNLAVQIAAATNTDPQYTEFQQIRFTAKDDPYLTKQTLFVPYVRDTSSREESHLTGMADLDWLLIYLFVLFPLTFGVIYFFNAVYQTQGNSTKQSLSTFRAMGWLNVLFMTAWAVGNYAAAEVFPVTFGTKPFSGAMFLCFGAIFTVRYLQMVGMTQPEFDRLIEQNGGAIWKAFGLREWLRFQLRDIFWLTLAIGLSCAIYTEHRRAQTLSGDRGRSQWWSNAVFALQEELARK